MHDTASVVYAAPVRRALLTWSDAGTAGPAPAHHAPRPAGDRGPVLRLLDESDRRYDAAWILSIPAGREPTEKLARAAQGRCGEASVRVIEVDDPSDYRKLFRALGPVIAAARRDFPPGAWTIDVLLSAGTPQAQTLWVVLVQAGMLEARMLQVIPAVFVGKTHPRAIREVKLDIEGFPEIRALRAEVRRLRAETRGPAAELVGESEPMRALRSRVARIAASEVPVLVLGETGTGKELVARAIHAGGARSKGPFVAENCGVFAEGVAASELFGHEAGAFTGAAARRRGVFEQAHGGTLLLDEVGELAPRVQTGLLRVLQEGALRRVGGEAKVAVDVRVIAATHRDLSAMVAEGSFREDLYYRLRGATVEVPPLRERAGDVPLLVRAFLGDREVEVTREAMRALGSYPWPGNVRELGAEVMRWSVFCEDRVDLADLAPEIRSPEARRAIGAEPAAPSEVTTLAAAVEVAERAAIGAAMRAEQGNLSRAARALGIDRNTLKRKLAGHGLRET